MLRAPGRSLGQGWRAGRSVRAWRIGVRLPRSAAATIAARPTGGGRRSVRRPGVLAMLATHLTARHQKNAESCRIWRKPTETERNRVKKCTLFHHLSDSYFNLSADASIKPHSERASGGRASADLSLLRRWDTTWLKLRGWDRRPSNRSKRSDRHALPRALGERGEQETVEQDSPRLLSASCPAPCGRVSRAGDSRAVEPPPPARMVPSSPSSLRRLVASSLPKMHPSPKPLHYRATLGPDRPKVVARGSSAARPATRSTTSIGNR